MKEFKFRKELYSKSVLLKASFAFTDTAYIHLDADDEYYYVRVIPKDGNDLEENAFINEMLCQAVRHEVYLQTKNIRELLLARAVSSSVLDTAPNPQNEREMSLVEGSTEDEILRSWFDEK